MKNKKGDDWFPLWIDKWIFGSTRIELLPDERGVWIDLLAISKKDDGYIRANEGVPYLDTQLMGLFNIDLNLLHRTINKCIKFKKIEKLKDKTLFVLSEKSGKYELSRRHKRRYSSKTDTMSAQADTMSGKADTKRRGEERRIEKNRKERIYKKEKKEAKKRKKPSPTHPTVKKSLLKEKNLYITILKNCQFYPFDLKQDGEIFNLFSNNYPGIDLVEQTKRKIKFWEENPEFRKSKKGLREQLFDFFEIEVEYQRRKK